MNFGLSVFVLTAVIFALTGFIHTRKKRISHQDFLGSKKTIGTAGLVSTIFA